MQGLLQFLLRNNTFFLFLLLEGLSFFLIVRFNAYHRNLFVTSANRVSGSLQDRFDRAASFFKLDEEVERLARENAALRARLQQSLAAGSLPVFPDSIRTDRERLLYSYQPARVISNSVNRENNFLTVSLPAGHSVEAGMGVISPSGVVGIVQSVSRHYASVMSLLHRQCHISAAIHQKEVFGNLSWRSVRPDLLQLEDVPSHQTVVQGDVVETSGYSFIFPPGIPIGTVEEVRLPEGSYFYDIDVKLATNMAGLHTVYVIQYEDQEELDTLRAQSF